MRFPLCLALVVGANALPSFWDRVHWNRRRSDPPKSPIEVESADFLCTVYSENAKAVRDLGFVGKIGNLVVRTWGDTLSNTSEFYMTTDSSSVDTADPCYYRDTSLTGDGKHPTELLKFNPEWGDPPETIADGTQGIHHTVCSSANTMSSQMPLAAPT
jgi:hypothetical protein